MKKFLVLLLTIALVFSLTACGGKTEPSGADKTKDSEKNEPVNDEPEYTMGETVIIDDENCTFKVTAVDPDGYSGFTLEVYCENKTADTTLMFSFGDSSVNGYMIDPFWSTEVAAGKKENSKISFSSSDLEKCNITSVDEITFNFHVYDSNDWSADDLIDDEFAIYPTGLTAETVVYPQRSTVDGEEVIIDNDEISFIIESVDPDSIWGYTLNCYIENKTEDPLMFSWNDVSVNGYMSDPYWASEVEAGKRSYVSINFSSSDFETNKIETVTDIEFKLHVYNSEDWSASDVCDEVFTYQPK